MYMYLPTALDLAVSLSIISLTFETFVLPVTVTARPDFAAIDSVSVRNFLPTYQLFH